MVARGEFREDLYYRLRVVEIHVPPLRARGQAEIVTLARHFLDLYARRHHRPGLSLGEPALAALVGHPWPGNVRELEHAIERAVVVAETDTLGPADLGLRSARVEPEARRAVSVPLGLPLEEVERRYVEATLEDLDGNVSRAAETLRIGRNTLKRKRGS